MTQLSGPPPAPIAWIGRRNDKPQETAKVTAQTWFEARRLAMTKLHVGPHELTVCPLSEDGEPEKKQP